MAQCGTGSTQEGGKTSRKIIDWDVLHARIQDFLPGGVQARLPKTALTTFFLVLNLLNTVVIQWFISKKTIISQGFRGQRGSNIFQGGPTFSRGVQLFPGGLNANLYRNPYNSGPPTPPPPPRDPHMY